MRYYSNYLILFFLTISIVLQSCKHSPAIDEKKFIKIYADMVIMQDTSSISQQKIKEEVLKRFNVKKNEYDETIKFYNADPERWQKFFDSTIVYLESLKPKPRESDVKSLPEQSESEGKKNL